MSNFNINEDILDIKVSNNIANSLSNVNISKNIISGRDCSNNIYNIKYKYDNEYNKVHHDNE